MTAPREATRPPRGWEVLLEGFGATRTYAQDLIGDLAEEFAARAARDGRRSANAWYRGQTMRSIPHLFVDWFRTARRPDYLSVLKAVWISYLCVVVMGLMGTSFLRSGLATAHIYAGPPLASRPVDIALVSTFALANGYIVAALCEDAPLIAVLAFPILVSVATAIGPVVATFFGVLPQLRPMVRANAGGPGVWYMPLITSLAVITIWLVMAPLGGTLRLLSRARQHRHWTHASRT